VERLAAILRLAGGLDRSHSQQIKDVAVQADGAGLELFVKSDFNPEVDLWGARRRVKLFRKVFGTKLDVEWDESSGQTGEAAPGDASGEGHANGSSPRGVRRKAASRREKR
jgi:exopolyphosphatase/guanosine-5'-triphosphate,3'-diphosphate pyrophosphatase